MPLALSLAVHKIHHHRLRSLILGLPIALLIAIISVLFSWMGAFHYKVETEIVQPNQVAGQTMDVASVQTVLDQSSGQDAGLKGVIIGQIIPDSEIDWLRQLDGVEDVSPSYHLGLPGQFSLPSLSDQDFNYTLLQTLEPELAKVYRVDHFTYQADQPIPVILGSSALDQRLAKIRPGESISGPVNDIDSWSNKVEEYRSGRQQLTSQLIGQTITYKIKFLPDAPQVLGGESVNGLMTRTGLTTQQQQAYMQAQDRLLSPYWHTSQLAKPLALTFKVVGINVDNSGESTSLSYIPTDAALYILNQAHQHLQSARTATPIPSHIFQQTILGSIIRQGIYHPVSAYASQVPYVSQDELAGPTLVSLPSLLLQAIRDTNGQLHLVELADYHFTQGSLRRHTLVLKISDPNKRQSIIEAIGYERGYSARGTQQDGAAAYMAQLSKALLIIVFILGSLVGLAMFISCWGYASDSSHEVGLLRALGLSARKSRLVILIQLMIIFIFMTILALMLGWLTTQAAAPWSADMLNQNFMAGIFGHDSSGQSVVKLTVNEVRLFRLDYILPYTALALCLPILAASIALHRRLKTDPLQALKNL